MNALVFFAIWAGPRSTMRKILFLEPIISRLRNSMKTPALTPPSSLIMNLIWPREVTAEIRLMLYRAPELNTTGVSPFFAPGPACMMIRAHMRSVAEIDLGVFPPRKSFDPRVFLLEPLLHQRLVALQGMIQRLLTADPELRQKPSNGD